MSDYPKPLPVPDQISEPFWSGLREGELRLQRCTACQRHQFYPRAGCMHCGGLELEWTPTSGRGSIHSYTVVRRTGVPGWREEVPYVVALVDLDEGARMQTNVVDCSPDAVTVGARVRLDPRPATDEITLPLFVLDS